MLAFDPKTRVDRRAFIPLPSAATVPLGAYGGSCFRITGTTTITSFGALPHVRPGQVFFVVFAGALTLTYNATRLILQGGSSIPTSAGDSLIALYEGGGNWRVLRYFYAAIPGNAASQAQQETGTDTISFVTPGRQQYHPSATKAWCLFTEITTTAITASYNVTSVSDGGTGVTQVNYTVAFSSANYSIAANGGEPATTLGFSNLRARATGSATVGTSRATDGALTDFSWCELQAWGDQ